MDSYIPNWQRNEPFGSDFVDNTHYPRHKMVQGDDGSVVDVGPSNPLCIADPILEIARDNLTGLDHINKFGSNSDVDTGAPEDLWTQGGLQVPPTAARLHDITSSSGDDDNDDGTGARTVRVYGLDENWAEVNEDVILNGVGDVPTVNTYLRIYRMSILTAGSGGTNAGAITATAQTDATVTASIAIGEGQSLMAIYTVPAGKTAYMTRMYATLSGSGAPGRIELSLKQRIGIDTAVPALRTRHKVSFDTSGTSSRSWRYIPYKVFTEKTDVIMRIVSANVNNMTVHGGFDLILVTN